MGKTIDWYECRAKKESKKSFAKWFFKLMHKAVSRQTMTNIGKDRNIELLTNESRRNYLVSEPSYHGTKFWRRKL